MNSKQKYENLLFTTRQKKQFVKKQIEALTEKLNTNSANNPMWMDWWQEKTDLNNKLCYLIGTENNYERKLSTL